MCILEEMKENYSGREIQRGEVLGHASVTGIKESLAWQERVAGKHSGRKTVLGMLSLELLITKKYM